MKNYTFYISVSFFIHLFVFLGLFLSHSRWSFFSEKKLIQSSIRVDMIGLPEIEKKKARFAKSKKEKTISIKKKKSKNKKSKKKKSKKDQNKKLVKKDGNKDKVSKKDNTKKGNKISQGIEGGVSEKEQTEIVNIYLTQVIGSIKLNWKLPKYLTENNYFAQMEVRINNEGRVIEKKIVISSNNELFDSRVLKAIEDSEPFSPPPKEVRKLISDGIVFRLSSRD